MLKDKILFITGSTGIAAATAELAARAGARVFVTSRTPEHGRELAARTGCTFHSADLTEPGAADEAVATCARLHGRLDAVFNVAGISGRRFGDGPVHECSDEGWDAVLDSNLSTLFRVCRAAVRTMLAQTPGPDGLRGSLLNMASVLALSPQAGHFATHAYAASKGAIVSLTRAMAASYAPHKIRVNVIAPALVRTPMSARAQSDPAILALMKTKQPLTGDLIEAEDVARSALFLLGPDSRAVTADVLTVDGGWSVSG
jgi:NAD(P)-dependent dehydrogenase (short-subunit alcohol dehydrogenase family)